MYNEPDLLVMSMLASHKIDARVYYDKLAIELNKNPERIHAVPERQKEFKQLTTDVCNYFENMTVLELACGIGYWTEKLITKSVFVYATDISEVAIKLAKQKIVSDKVSFFRVDANALNIQPINVKGIFAGFFLSHLKRGGLETFFTQLQSQLPTGTQFLFVDNEYISGGERPYRYTFFEANAYELRPLKDGSEHLVVKNCFSDEELKSALGPKAFDIKITRTNFFWSLCYCT